MVSCLFFQKKKNYAQASPRQFVDVNLKVIHFSVATQEQSTKFNAVEILKGTKVFFLGTLLYVSPGQVIGHFNDDLGLWIMIVQFFVSEKSGISVDIDVHWRRTR